MYLVVSVSIYFVHKKSVTNNRDWSRFPESTDVLVLFCCYYYSVEFHFWDTNLFDLEIEGGRSPDLHLSNPDRSVDIIMFPVPTKGSEYQTTRRDQSQYCSCRVLRLTSSSTLIPSKWRKFL